MAGEALVAKLNTLLAKGVSSEAEVVYLLAETRKLLELKGEKRSYEMLTFFCEWALHPSMDRTTAAKYIELFDGFHKAINHDIQTDLANSAFEGLDKILTLLGFREELASFFRSQEISDSLFHGNTWPQFLNLYAAVIEDCPMKIGSDAQTKYVSKITVQLKEGEAPEDFVVNWEVSFKQPEPQYGMVTTFSVSMKDFRKQPSPQPAPPQP